MELIILLYVAVGFFAQMIDGCLGMAYGVSSNTFLLSLGLPPAAASASVHLAEVFTTAVSGFSHFRLGNVDKEVFKRLVLPGVIGGIIGAYLLTTLPSKIIAPIVSVYLLLMGIRILVKGVRNLPQTNLQTNLTLLGVVGGFSDAIGGGGWGPIVTTTLLSRGGKPRFTIGSVNLSEFFVTLAESITFIGVLGISNWQVILGLIVGGVIAAPFGAYLCKRLLPRTLLIVVGGLITFLSLRNIYLAF
jgi:uncharacterized membrane protein YfcA